MRKFTTHIYTKANYLLNRGRMALSNLSSMAKTV